MRSWRNRRAYAWPSEATDLPDWLSAIYYLAFGAVLLFGAVFLHWSCSVHDGKLIDKQIVPAHYEQHTGYNHFTTGKGSGITIPYTYTTWVDTDFRIVLENEDGRTSSWSVSEREYEDMVIGERTIISFRGF